MTARRNGRARVEAATQRGGEMLGKAGAVLFRVVAFLVMLPVLAKDAAAGDWWGVVIGLAFAVGLPALLAPMPDD